VGTLLGALAASSPAAPLPSFSREVLPILSDNCFYCHGPDAKHRKADLRLDLEAEAKASRDGSTAIVPGSLEKSDLIARVLSKDPDEVMPPPKSHKKLSPAQIDILQRWVQGGAPWGVHWAFSELQRPSVPARADAAHPVDAFVRQRLETESISSAPQAEKLTLLRRVSLDLTGLPPSQETRQRFLADASADAYEKLVDSLLASPAFGERMAWDWMDVARYADTNGYQGDSERTMWPWRDWVVSAFNRNLPYDQFTLWQIAGDLLPSPSEEQKLATGFLRNHPINGEGGRIAEENRVDYVMDMAETTGTAWLALTFNCCRCHDHKFDPLTNRDYYSLFAFFNQTPVTGGGGNPQTPPALDLPDESLRKRISDSESALADIEKQKRETTATLIASQPAWEQAAHVKPLASTWRVLHPASAKATHQTLTIQDDASILASGENPASDSYELLFQPEPAPLAAFRLEAIRHPSMTRGGFARSDSGNFVLTDFEILLQRPGKQPEKLPIASAIASFEQGDFKVTKAFDKDPKSGWAVWDGKSIERDQEAVFRLSATTTLAAGDSLLVRLKHDSPHSLHNLGNFRLSASANPEAKLGSTQSEIAALLLKPATERSSKESELVRTAFLEAQPELIALTTKVTSLKDKLAALRKESPKVMVMEDQAKPRQTFILDHGLYNKPLAEVAANTPGHLPPLSADAPHNRLGLARWLIARENPLPARVAANRLWQMIFGIGLVKTAEDFGVQSEFPKHPELLDWLAVELRDSGWDVKHFLRTLVTSSTYRQSSRIAPGMAERDPDNRLLARGPRFRMPSWMVRDQALAASGLLVPRIGGPPVKPYQPPGVWEEATFGNKKYQQDHGDDLHRRSLYTFWRRIVGPTMFFDAPARSVCSVKPTRTNTPLHALSTLNDPTYVEAARILAEQVMIKDQDPETRLHAAFQRILIREPHPAESRVLLAGLERQRARFANQPDDALRLLETGEHPRDKNLAPADHAAWTMLCVALLNLDETLTKE